MSRKYTNQLLEMVEEGLISTVVVTIMCMKYMSDDDVKDMMEANELLEEVEE